jgi:putative membrane protein
MLDPAIYPYAKALHLLAIISWMAGIFYLPRIFVHYVEGKNAGEDVRRLKVMARKLYHFTSMVAVFALASGLWLWLGFGFSGGWLHAKLAVVVLLIAYHISTRVFMKRMQRDAPLPGSITLRWYNELPLLLLLAILWLVVLKPF